MAKTETAARPAGPPDASPDAAAFGTREGMDSASTVLSLEDAASKSLAARIARAWRDTVGAYATDEGETKNLLRRLVDFGALSRDEATRALHEMRARIEENRAELDRRVEESLKHAVARLILPSPAELARLREQVAALEERVKRAEEAESP